MPMKCGDFVWVIYYDGQPYDAVQNVGRSSTRSRQPRRVYWYEGHAKAALRGIVDDMKCAASRSWRRQNEPVYDPDKFSIKKFRLVEESEE